MDYNQALDYIFSLPKFSYPLGNEQLSALLAELGYPHRDMKIIHIAGTNGKGSAAAMLSAIMSRAGYKTGVFTSPFIIRFNERICIGDVQIPDKRLAAIVSRVSECEIKVSQFAFILACAFLYYKEENCDYVILEAGLGGRLDATNVIDESLLSVIMSIGLDHTEYLGDTVEKIAAEKCGIIKLGGRVAAYRNNNAADAVIEEFCKSRRASLEFSQPSVKTDGGFICGGREYPLALEGEYQAANAACVLSAVNMLHTSGVNTPDDAVIGGFANCRWRARFERVRRNVIVDGAHNPDGVRSLCKSVDRLLGRKIAVVAMMSDKAVGECAQILSHHFDKIYVTQLDMPRCMGAEELAKLFGGKAEIYENCCEAFCAAEKSGDTAVICGSLYLAGRALEYFGSNQ